MSKARISAENIQEASNTPSSASIFVPSPAVIASTLSLDALRLPQGFGQAAGVRKLLTTVPVRRPSPQHFFRVRPGSEWRIEAAMLNLIKDENEHYLVLPHLWSELAGEIRAKMLYTCVTRDGVVFLWPVNLPDGDGRLDNWSQSAHDGAEIAEDSWIRLIANRSLGAYDVHEAVGELPPPEWPNRSFEELALR